MSISDEFTKNDYKKIRKKEETTANRGQVFLGTSVLSI